MYRIMIIEDDTSLRNQMEEILRSYGYEVVSVTDFQNILPKIDEIKPDLIILDINLPYFDGNYYCRTIRKQYHMPIIITSARGGEADQILSMELGCDDYVVKPFSISILISRVAASLRRSYGEYMSGKEQEQGIYGMLLWDSSMKLSFRGKKIELTKNEYRMMKLFLQNPDTVLTREQLLDAIWDDKDFVDDNTLTVNITRLKTKMQSFELNSVIQTKRGTGYCFCTSELAEGGECSSE